MRIRTSLAISVALALTALMVATGWADIQVLFDGATARARCAAGYPGTGGPDPLSPCQWDMETINATDAYQQARGAGATVGVIDGGVDFNHPDLAGVDIARSCSFIYNSTPTADVQEVANGDCSNKGAVQDLQGHGTHVATIIAGRVNGIGIGGVAPEATIVGLKACTVVGYCFADSVAAALRYAGDLRLDIVNLSLFADPYLYTVPMTPVSAPFCKNCNAQPGMPSSAGSSSLPLPATKRWTSAILRPTRSAPTGRPTPRSFARFATTAASRPVNCRVSSRCRPPASAHWPATRTSGPPSTSRRRGEMPHRRPARSSGAAASWRDGRAPTSPGSGKDLSPRTARS